MKLKIFKKHSSVDFNKDGHDILTLKAAIIQITLSMIANLTCLAPGMGISFPAITSEILLRDTDTKLTSNQVSWFASIIYFVCPLGGPLSAYTLNKIGRKGTMILINTLSIFHWVIIGFSSKSNTELFFIELIVARVIGGLTVGMITATTMMYAIEISHVKLKSRLAVLSAPLFMSIGILTIYLFGYMTRDNYRLAALYALGVALFSLLGCLLIPESPVYLINKNKIEKARRVMAILGNIDAKSQKVEQQIEKLQQVHESSSTGINVIEEFKKPEFYKPLFIMFSFFAIQQLSGIFTLFVLTARFSIEAGMEMDVFLSAVLFGAIRVVLTFVISFVMNKYGRKRITILSSSGMLFSMIGLVVCKVVTLGESLSWLPGSLLFIFCIFGVPGVLALPFVMVAEVYPHKSRGLGIGLTISFCFIVAFITIKTFTFLFEFFGSAVIFSFYAFMSAVGIIFSVYFLPETKGKTAQDMENYFKK